MTLSDCLRVNLEFGFDIMGVFFFTCENGVIPILEEFACLISWLDFYFYQCQKRHCPCTSGNFGVFFNTCDFFLWFICEDDIIPIIEEF